MGFKKVPDDLKKLLIDSGLPWRVENGGKHFKVFVGDRLATVLPFSPGTGRQRRRSHSNVLAVVRRVIAEQAQ
jgi:hypothetical protein